jgi:hypothetical protein
MWVGIPDTADIATLLKEDKLPSSSNILGQVVDECLEHHNTTCTGDHDWCTSAVDHTVDK